MPPQPIKPIGGNVALGVLWAISDVDHASFRSSERPHRNTNTPEVRFA